MKQRRLNLFLCHPGFSSWLLILILLLSTSMAQRESSSYRNDSNRQQQEQRSSFNFNNKSNDKEHNNINFSNVKSMLLPSKPRHVLQGLVSGLQSATLGASLGLVSVVWLPVAGWKQQQQFENYNNNNHGSDDNVKATKKWKGLVAGSIAGSIVGGVSTTAGVVRGFYQFIMGIVSTPHTLNCWIFQGRTYWNTTLDDWDTYSFEQEEEEIRLERGASANDGHVVDTELYDLLHVSTDASSGQIKKAYYRLAKELHPDKGGDPEQFRKIHAAYATLYDENSRAAYDQQGISIDDTNSNVVLTMDPYLFFEVLLGSQMVEPFIGDLTVAHWFEQIITVYNVMHAKQQKGMDAESLSKIFIDSSKDKRRQLSVAKHLLNMTSLFSTTATTENGDTQQQQVFSNVQDLSAHFQSLATEIAESTPFGSKFLVYIGSALLLETSSSTMVRPLRKTKRSMECWTRLAFQCYHLTRATMDIQANSTTHNSEDFAMSREQLTELVPSILQLSWSLIQMDIDRTLAGAYSRLMADASAQHSTSKNAERKKRRRVMRVLGRAFYKVGQQSMGGQTDDQNEEWTTSRLEIAVQISRLKASGQDVPEDSESMIRRKEMENKVRDNADKSATRRATQ